MVLIAIKPSPPHKDLTNSVQRHSPAQAETGVAQRRELLKPNHPRIASDRSFCVFTAVSFEVYRAAHSSPALTRVESDEGPSRYFRPSNFLCVRWLHIIYYGNLAISFTSSRLCMHLLRSQSFVWSMLQILADNTMALTISVQVTCARRSPARRLVTGEGSEPVDCGAHLNDRPAHQGRRYCRLLVVADIHFRG